MLKIFYLSIYLLSRYLSEFNEYYFYTIINLNELNKCFIYLYAWRDIE